MEGVEGTQVTADTIVSALLLLFAVVGTVCGFLWGKARRRKS